MANKVLNTKIIIRNDTKANFETQNPTLLKGEVALETDTGKYKVGNGIDAYKTLPYYVHLDGTRSSHLDTLIGMLGGGDFGGVADVKVNGESVVDEGKVASVVIASISYSTASQGTDSDNLTNESITLHKIAKTGAWSDLVGRPNVVDNLNSTSGTDILSAKQGNELKKLVQAIPQATSFTSITNMISTLNSASKTAYNVGHDLYIVDRGVPDFWISSVESTAANYTGSATDLINALKNQDTLTVQIGYYKISLLETVKVDLINYVTTEALSQAIAALGVGALKTSVGNLESKVGDANSGLVKDVSDLKTTTGGHETRIKAIEEDTTIIRTTDFVVLNGGDSKTANS